MTPKQEERLRKKISNIRRTLAAEKRKFGGYDDSRGLRYVPVRYFMQLHDYQGGLTYLRWFNKNFPDDGGFPDFLFDWTIILFQCGKTKEAARKAFETFCANAYLFNKYFDRPIIPIDKWEGSNVDIPEFADQLTYSAKQPELAAFSVWLNDLIETVDFRNRCEQYIDIYKRLKTENDREARRALLMQARQLIETA
ncbi:hypothetical protein [Longitalea luteola]|uniref:hypothetical protein n=1 Tax=Longitalea luteola TaxID=2812563 RepID=UPI001A9605BF|nr:hypothetical protein [Longitalea luteola]